MYDTDQLVWSIKYVPLKVSVAITVFAVSLLYSDSDLELYNMPTIVTFHDKYIHAVNIPDHLGREDFFRLP